MLQELQSLLILSLKKLIIEQSSFFFVLTSNKIISVTVEERNEKSVNVKAINTVFILFFNFYILF